MPRIILTATHAPSAHTPSSRDTVLLAESVQSVHLSSDHSAQQLIERLRWALADAEALERATLSARDAFGTPHASGERTRAAA
jgi:hypothetical protein